jgi:hypothetical protein
MILEMVSWCEQMSVLRVDAEVKIGTSVSGDPCGYFGPGALCPCVLALGDALTLRCGHCFCLDMSPTCLSLTALIWRGDHDPWHEVAAQQQEPGMCHLWVPAPADLYHM